MQEISALYSVSALYVTRTALYEESTSRVTTNRELGDRPWGRVGARRLTNKRVLLI